MSRDMKGDRPRGESGMIGERWPMREGTEAGKGREMAMIGWFVMTSDMTG